MRYKILLTWIFVLLSIGSCQRSDQLGEDPKSRLQDYISKSFSVRGMEDRAVLAGYLTGEAKKRLYAWSEDQFREAFIDSKRNFVKMVIHEIKSITPDEKQITYEITYIDQGRGHDAKVTSKKMCQMNQEKSRWYISNVKNVKELVEYKNELSLP